MKFSSKVVLSLKAQKDFEKIKEKDSVIFNHLTLAFKNIEQNVFSGIQIPKKLIPKKYIKEHNVENLWKFDLPKAYRLIYTIKRNEIEIVAIVIEWMNHTKYERKFKY